MLYNFSNLLVVSSHGCTLIFMKKIYGGNLSEVGTRIVTMAKGFLEPFSNLGVWSNI